MSRKERLLHYPTWILITPPPLQVKLWDAERAVLTRRLLGHDGWVWHVMPLVQGGSSPAAAAFVMQQACRSRSELLLETGCVQHAGDAQHRLAETSLLKRCCRAGRIRRQPPRLLPDLLLLT